jgi:hypothetical protein
MVIYKIDVCGAFIRKAENDAPITGYGDRPQAREITFQPMQAHAG